VALRKGWGASAESPLGSPTRHPPCCGWRLERSACSRLAVVRVWRWSLSRLWVAQSSFHSALQAASPRRMNRRAPRACLIWPMSGSTVVRRMRSSRCPRGVSSRWVMAATRRSLRDSEGLPSWRGSKVRRRRQNHAGVTTVWRAPNPSPAAGFRRIRPARTRCESGWPVPGPRDRAAEHQAGRGRPDRHVPD
jgi:hypothetical protein